MTTLTLGTASLGMPGYGVASRHALAPDESRFLLQRAAEEGLGLDTAAAYGNAEALIGESRVGGAPMVTTKLLPGLAAHPSLLPALIEREVRASRAALRWGGPLTVLFHTPVHGSDPRYVDALRHCKDLGLCDRIGTSVYAPEDLVALVPMQDVVQVPYSVLDRRFEALLLARAPSGLAVQVRAPFCQGLALLDPEGEEFPPARAAAAPLLAAFRRVCAAHRFGLVEAALVFAMESNAETVVFGVDEYEQLAEDLRANVAADQAERDRWASCLAALRAELPVAAAEVVNPSLWARA